MRSIRVRDHASCMLLLGSFGFFVGYLLVKVGTQHASEQQPHQSSIEIQLYGYGTTASNNMVAGKNKSTDVAMENKKESKIKMETRKKRYRRDHAYNFLLFFSFPFFGFLPETHSWAQITPTNNRKCSLHSKSAKIIEFELTHVAAACDL